MHTEGERKGADRKEGTVKITDCSEKRDDTQKHEITMYLFLCSNSQSSLASIS